MVKWGRLSLEQQALEEFACFFGEWLGLFEGA